MNQNNQCVLNEQDVVTAWLKDRDITMAVFDEPEPIQQYNDWCFAQDIDATIQALEEYTGDDYVEHCVHNWNMPDEYKELDIVRFLNNRELTHEQRERLHMEIDMFRERGLIDVLRFLAYLVDLCKEHNIVLGVGRGSSVASYCLYLLGVHKIDSIKYKLDITEFLK